MDQSGGLIKFDSDALSNWLGFLIKWALRGYRNGHDGLAQAHLVSEDAVEAFVNASGGKIASKFNSQK
jgi:hypothetical protein